MDHEDVREHDAQVVADADADLVQRTRSGDKGAFGELWRRHYRAGVTVARNMTSSLDADDLVQEAYTRIYHSIVNGGGPTGSFRAYLFTSIRNTAAAWGRARRETAYEELDGVEDPTATEHESEAALDRGLTHRAFRSLPTRWQEVLWYSEIERMKPAEIAPLLGMKATAVAQLTFRAREGLREAWIQAHLRSVADGSDCQWTIERLGAYSRLNLGRRDHAKLERHLAGCVRCSIVASEAKEVSSRLALVLLPLAVGALGTAGYLASLQGGGAPLVALAATPTCVAPGSATVLPASVVGAGTAAGSTGTAAGTGAAGGTIAAGAAFGVGGVATATGGGATVAGVTGAAFVTAGGSALMGIGAASGLAAASLVVVGGVVAAAVTLPPATSVPTPSPTAEAPAVAPATVPGILDSAEDSPLHLADGNGPGPADLPVVTDSGSARTDTIPRGAGAAFGSGQTTAGDGDSSGTAHGAPTNGTGYGNGGNTGNEGGMGNGAPTNGTGNGNGGNTGSDVDSGYGTPTNGNGNGNGGSTGNEGDTGNGTPTNGTGNGNGGTTGNGNGAANGKGNAYGATNGGASLLNPTVIPLDADAGDASGADNGNVNGADSGNDDGADDANGNGNGNANANANANGNARRASNDNANRANDDSDGSNGNANGATDDDAHGATDATSNADTASNGNGNGNAGDIDGEADAGPTGAGSSGVSDNGSDNGNGKANGAANGKPDAVDPSSEAAASAGANDNGPADPNATATNHANANANANATNHADATNHGNTGGADDADGKNAIEPATQATSETAAGDPPATSSASEHSANVDPGTAPADTPAPLTRREARAARETSAAVGEPQQAPAPVADDTAEAAPAVVGG